MPYYLSESYLNHSVDAHIDGIVNVNLKAALEATVQVCLCVQASVANSKSRLSTSI